MNNDDGKTGNFEVRLNGTTVHTKQGGQGFCNTPEKQKALISAMRKIMAQ